MSTRLAIILGITFLVAVAIDYKMGWGWWYKDDEDENKIY